MVEYIKLKPGDELWKAEILNEQTFLEMLTDEQFTKIEDGRCMELKGVCYMQRQPLYGISPQIDYEKRTPYIELLKTLMQIISCRKGDARPFSTALIMLLRLLTYIR